MKHVDQTDFLALSGRRHLRCIFGMHVSIRHMRQTNGLFSGGKRSNGCHLFLRVLCMRITMSGLKIGGSLTVRTVSTQVKERKKRSDEISS